jgi:hypothetical protein
VTEEYRVRFESTRAFNPWEIVCPEGTVLTRPTLQQAVDDAKQMACGCTGESYHVVKVDVVWEDREGHEQGRARGWHRRGN